jgi:hypothetical protein
MWGTFAFCSSYVLFLVPGTTVLPYPFGAREDEHFQQYPYMFFRPKALLFYSARSAFIKLF